MMPERARDDHTIPERSPDGARGSLLQRVASTAEKELERALLARSGSTMMMYGHSSSAENAAMERAVHTICGEAHRLDLRAEELIVAVKQAWSQLAHVRARHLGDQDGDVLREVVSSSIEVFFLAQHEEARKRHD
ncbi:MAG: hypothetical protein DMD35_07895 [Gemmatimonadetes bacterium]|nr:MAG: hypothetical protein DMD35_07895 [Gemmatimonadota bacterium]